MKALIFEDRVVDIAEKEYGVAQTMKWMDAPEGCKFNWVLDDGSLVAPPNNFPPAINVLRMNRNLLIEETDWWANSDLTMTEEQIAYRQKLRDLPATTSPELDSEGQIIGVTWPDKP